MPQITQVSLSSIHLGILVCIQNMQPFDRRDGEHNTTKRRAGRYERRESVIFVSTWRRVAGFMDYGVDAIDGELYALLSRGLRDWVEIGGDAMNPVKKDYCNAMQCKLPIFFLFRKFLD